jgi:hypothetical protein
MASSSLGLKRQSISATEAGVVRAINRDIQRARFKTLETIAPLSHAPIVMPPTVAT